MPLAKWYTNSAEAASALSNALDSRLNLTRDATEEHSQQPLSVADARQRGRFLRLSEAGDLEVRIFDDIFLGHALSVGGAAVPNMTVLSFLTAFSTTFRAARSPRASTAVATA